MMVMDAIMIQAIQVTGFSMEIGVIEIKISIVHGTALTLLEQSWRKTTTIWMWQGLTRMRSSYLYAYWVSVVVILLILPTVFVGPQVEMLQVLHQTLIQR